MMMKIHFNLTKANTKKIKNKRGRNDQPNLSTLVVM
jgi:hypothetical protein